MADVPESTELKSCPFCGGKAIWGQADDGGHYIECSKCWATTSLTYYLMEDASDKVRAAWNTRKPAASPVAPPESERIAEIEARLNQKTYCGYSEQAQQDIAYLLKSASPVAGVSAEGDGI